MIHVHKLFNYNYFRVNDVKFFFIHNNKKRYVIQDKCPHRGGPLSLGKICNIAGTVECPWHDNKFKISFLIKKSIAAIRVGDEILYVQS